MSVCSLHLQKYEIRITVNNTVYIWSNMAVAHHTFTGTYQLMLEGNPKVINRIVTLKDGFAKTVKK